MIKLLLADDHQVLLDGIRSLLENVHDMQVVGVAHDGREVLEFVGTNAVDMVLLDIQMPAMDGLEACTLIKKDHPGVRVIAMSMFGEGQMVQAMLNNGANGYLLKSCGAEELVEAIRNVHGGGTWLSQNVIKDLVHVMNTPQPTASRQHHEEITARELMVLKLIAEELTTSEIADELGITVNTVESHRRHLLSKLGVRNSAGLVRKAMEYKLLDQ